MRSRSTMRRTAGDCTRPAERFRRNLAPAHLRHRVAEEAIDDPTALLCIDEAVVDVTAVGDGLLDGRACDLVEDHPTNWDLRLQHLEEVPRDGLTLAILICGEVEPVGVLKRRLQVTDDLLLR